MADQGLWFKLWTSVLDDPALRELSIEDFGRWCIFGAFLKKHGNDGMICLSSPATILQEKFRLSNYKSVVETLHKFPNCVVSEKQNLNVTPVTILTVTWGNWLKYQGDFSRERTRMWRHRVTVKKRREEKRGEEKEKRTIAPTPQSEWFEKIWEEYPQKGRIKKQEAFRRFTTSVLDVDTAKRCAAALDKYLDSKRVKDGFIQNAPTWFGDWMSWENYTDGTTNS